ncbi:hypothetical protein SAY86_012950 [Trapa natans]|uniref:FHA domain-containing protein n=1 Tax=Trapa natans TaxID=22666 RepID=A0AAN7RC28_TRANT|nr:hypothetical protein SAY86_012950 [Trapa natans]
MGALAPDVRWIPQDDLILKNAVEAGGSLESLAKGAVRFSRRFTLRELVQRWYSLLYNPLISAEASVHMVELERSAPKLPSKLSNSKYVKGSKNFSMKRKSSSVRNCFYSFCKRARNDPINSEYPAGPNYESCHQVEDDDVTWNHMLGDSNSPLFELQESDLEILRAAFPDIIMNDVNNTTTFMDTDVEKPTRDFPVEQDDLSKEMPGPLGKESSCEELFGAKSLGLKQLLPGFAPTNHNGKDVCQGMEQNGALNYPVSFHGLDPSSPLPDAHICEDVGDIPVPLPTSQSYLSLEEVFPIDDRETYTENQSGASAALADLSYLLDFTKEEELLSLGVDMKDVFDMSYFDEWSSLLHNTPIDVNPERGTVNSPETVAALDASNTNMVCDNICKSEECVLSDVSGTATTQFSQTCNEFIFCTLNMEDPEIPCNDDIVFPIKLPSAQTFTKMGSSSLSRFEESGNLVSSHSTGVEFLAGAGSSERTSRIFCMNNEVPAQIIGLQVSTKPKFGDSLSRSEAPCNHHDAKVILQERIDPATPRPSSDHDKLQCQQLYKPSQFLDPPPYPAGHESEIGLSSSAPEQIESDDDLPSFRDVEAMVLDMDLDPDDQRLHNEKAMPLPYNDEVAKIMRLEQAANSYMKRAIASHGALAILYGLHSKFYIKKQEVLIGRGTENYKVDIDLRKEGRFRKISRQQAMLRLLKNGSFLLKNLGDKFPIMVNNKPIASGMGALLTPNCLIEFSGTALIFNMNPSCVKLFLERITREEASRANAEV